MTMTEQQDIASHRLALLRRMDGKIDRIIADLSDLKGRVTSLEDGQAVIIREMGRMREDMARQSGRMDRIDGRLDRIERRLDLYDAPLE
jgi:hypothetical protein